MSSLPTGKISSHLLRELIDTLPLNDPDLIVPPGIGQDAAGIQIGSQLVAVTTDPITFTKQRIGTYCVAVNINDLACLGCKPRWFTANLLLPPNTTETQLRQIWQELSEQLQKYQVTPIGGHTEVTDSVSAPILVGQMMGYPISDNLLNPQNAQPGDKILLWQPAAIEATALIAQEKAKQLEKYFSAAEIKTMQTLIDEPGICVLPLVEKMLPCEGIVALHDPTEGGLATALHELADAAKCGLVIKAEKLPIREDTQKLAEIFQVNPLGLLASGSLLILCRKEAELQILEKLRDEPIYSMGELTQNKDRLMHYSQKSLPLPRFDTDEIIKIIA
jgi:hydrogenase expression/formation protein HypE